MPFDIAFKKSQNIRGELSIPSDFADFVGFDGLAEKTGNPDPHTIRFGFPVNQGTIKIEK